MKKLVVTAFLAAGLVAGANTGVQAHSVEACVKQTKTYKGACKFSPTALIFGLCKVEKTLKMCKDKKQHDKYFH